MVGWEVAFPLKSMILRKSDFYQNVMVDGENFQE